MGSYTGLAQKTDVEATLRIVDSSITLCLTQEEAHDLFERVLHSNLDDTPASVQALKKLANAIGTHLSS